MSLILDEHREYLSDVNRLDAYRRAIGELVKPESVVVDLGSGSGILGLLACRAGARRVYCIEETALIGITREVFRANGYEDRVTFIKEFSAHASIPERADLVVCDQIGRFGFEAGILDYFADARKRFLKPEGRLLPSRIDLMVAPAEREDLWRQIEFWNQSPVGFDFGAARKVAVNTGYPTRYRKEEFLASPAIIASLDTGRSAGTLVGAEASMTIDRPGVLHGIGGWFLAQMSPGVTMSNGALAAKPINRRNVFFPIDRPIAVDKGDQVRVSMTIRHSDLLVAWNIEIRSGQATGATPLPKARFAHSTFKGMLLCQEDLERTQPGYVPKLTARGEARRSILDLCDGYRSLAEIEQEVFRRHPQLFASHGQAAAFVAEVIVRYSH